MSKTQRFFHSHAYIYTNLCSCNKSAHSAVKPLRGWQLYLEIKQERHTDAKKRKKATDDNRSRQNRDQGMRAKDRRVRDKVKEKVV